jgi:hypothetical protein
MSRRGRWGVAATGAGAAAALGTAGDTQARNDIAAVDRIANLHLQAQQFAILRTRHFHRGFVGFQRDQTLIFLQYIADLGQQFDDWHVFVSAQIRHFDLDFGTHDGFLDWHLQATIVAAR